MGSIKIRVDGSSEIGLGHLVRCKALADMLKGDFNVHFYCRYIPPSIQYEFEKSTLPVTVIQSELDYFNLLNNGDIAVLDGYGFDKHYQEKVKMRGALLVCIDDLAEAEFAADLIINHSPGVHKSDYNTLSESQFALGPDYVLLRSSFFREKVHFSESNLRKNLLICFGGSDVQNITEKAVKLALDFKEFNKIAIITGSAYRDEESLFNTINNCANCEYYHAVGEQKMAELMFDSDVAIVPASGILFEALATKNIVISGMYIDNQKINYKALRKKKAFIDAGRFTESEISMALERIKVFSPVDLVDGKSPDRLRTLFKKLSLRN